MAAKTTDIFARVIQGGLFKGTVHEWLRLSPGMRAEIARSLPLSFQDSLFLRLKRAIDVGLLDRDELVQAAHDQTFGTGNAGFCLNCGAERDSCEPDAADYECYECGENSVFGATDLAMNL